MNKEQLQNKLEEIAAVIQKQEVPLRPGLLTGNSGIGLFYFYYSRYANCQRSQDKAIDFLEESIQDAPNWTDMTTFCSGLAGMGWAIEHLTAQEFLDCEPDDVLEGLDDLVQASLTEDYSKKYFDYLHGAIGKGLYFLKRNNTESLSVAAEILDFVYSIAIQDKTGGFKWETHHLNEDIYKYNFSLSHGIPSILYYACKTFERKIRTEKSEAIIRKGIAYLLKHKTNSTSHLFPSWICSVKPSEYSRLAWCYGDLGIALVCFKAGALLNIPTYQQEAMRIFHHAARRRAPSNTLVKDAMICHGAAGNALIFQKMYQETNDEILKEAADFWLYATLNMALHPDGIAGYKYFREIDWSNETNILTGVSGIGLTLLAFLDPSSIDWSECLLLD